MSDSELLASIYTLKINLQWHKSRRECKAYTVTHDSKWHKSPRDAIEECIRLSSNEGNAKLRN